MVRANFEEKTFECAYNIELAMGVGGNPRVFSPGQVLENLLGFDSASAPGSAHVIWQVLRVPRPDGVSLVPSHWPPSPTGAISSEQLPHKPISLMLQFKRPEYLKGPRSRQRALWHGQPYYRFEREQKQHAVLRRLERTLASEAIVRYAAPAFHTLAALESAQIARTVIAQSGHVAPAVLGSHKVWTYQSAGVYGLPNPNGHELPFQTLEQLLIRVPTAEVQQSDALVPYDGLEIHLAAVAGACRDRNPRLRHAINDWSRQLEHSDARLDRSSALIDYATIHTFCAWQKISWFLLNGLETRLAPTAEDAS